MIDTLKLRIHGINDLKKDTLSQIQSSNGLTTIFAVPEHNDLYKAMLAHKGKDWAMTTVKSKEVFERSDREHDEFLGTQTGVKLNEFFQTRNVIRFVEENKVKEVNMSIHGTYRVPSSFNGISYRINESAGYIDFEFSVPKYLYGHSLAEFIPQINSTRYMKAFVAARQWRYQQKELFERLHEFIDIFIDDICNHFGLEALLNKRYIEIVRLDLCFNQWFGSKHDALRYLEHLRKINYKRYRDNQKAPVEYNTSITFQSSQGAYFKVYHKGSEYTMSQHGDYKKHLAENKKRMNKVLKRMLEKSNAKSIERLQRTLEKMRGGEHVKDPLHGAKLIKSEMIEIMQEMSKGTFCKDNYPPEVLRFAKKLYGAMPYKIDFFKNQMDKVLRYELSLRGSWFTYCYKNRIFRAEDEIHLNAYHKFKKTKQALERKGNTEFPTGRELANYKAISAYLGRKAHLMLETNFFNQRHESHSMGDFNSAKQSYRVSAFGLKHTILHDRDVGTFSNTLLKYAVYHFKGLVDEYQVKAISPDDDLEHRIVTYNSEVEENVKQYNERYYHKIYASNGKPRIKNGRKVTEAVQLLTQAQKSKLNLKKVRPVILLAINEQMKKGRSLREIRKGMKVSNSQWSRYKKDLDKFNIDERSRIDPNPIATKTDWSTFYDHVGNLDFYQKFYVRKAHSYYE
ncbi:phage/plasmid replication protein [Flagellimonas algicola]|uniref:Uncharacterized protein n=1 Tax=Flagellimonas algicola TaxID=2583815 RepID=A0ABY2WP09_9FLAO|nr:phage/plasmid replication protein [Allomuricauda algicola]TMU56482.1 hypothetical protein FGG15_02785 [Allomuricauda algicola]